MRILLVLMTLSLSFNLGVQNQQSMVSQSPRDVKLTFSDLSFAPPETLPRQHLQVKAMSIDGFSADGLKKLQRSFELLELVMNSEVFREQVINFRNVKGERAFSSNKGLSNEEIYDHLMEARENLLPDTPFEMNYYLKLYNRPWSKVIGYTNPDSNVININWKYFKNFEPHQVAANLAHEWVHKMGFDHKSAAELDSAPYAIGDLVEVLAKRFERGELH